MYKSLTKIAITGGPCSGKTTGLAKISSSLSDKGYEVVIIPEMATLVKSCGIKIDDEHISGYEFEEILFNLQLYFEEIYQEKYANKLKDKDVIIVCDRGIVDGRAYLTEKQYIRLLYKFGSDEVFARDAYDAVFHLKTVADGKEEFYTCENNEARDENAEEAREADKRTLNAWMGHSHLRVIDNTTDFDGKINRLMSEIYSFLGLPIPLEIEKKYLIAMPNLEVLKEKYHAVKSEIIQVYLKSKNENEEIRIRQRGQNGSYSYYLTKKIKRDDMSRYEIEEKISKDRYLSLLMEADTGKNIVRKTRYCFMYENQYFELDVYPFSLDKAILEIELTDENSKVFLPEDIYVIKEVTNDDKFKNSNIAKDSTIFS